MEGRKGNRSSLFLIKVLFMRGWIFLLEIF